VLVANRGEIAIRILRTLREQHIPSVAVFSEADRHARHVREADAAVAIGPSPAAQSYLRIDTIVEAARGAGADAVHPGYGFLSENAAFADACTEAGLVFIGPTGENIRRTGNKLGARRAVAAAGLPVVPGADHALADVDHARQVAAEVGYPVMLKAAGGGGGRGLRVVPDARALSDAFAMAQIEARAAFGVETLYLEKRIEHARHVEVQILGDGRGGAVHLGERNCSVQRRHQKMVEEAPSPALDPEVAVRLHDTAVRAVRALRYRNAGTVEFLVDPTGRFYFLEINARIQVEHPVTEAITGVDLVAAQITIAATGDLPFGQDDVRFAGHAIECRINAEDPDVGFMPQPGRVDRVRWPQGPGVRIDTHLYDGYDVPIFYDSLLAKLIVHADTREATLARLRHALDHVEITPLKTTTPFLRRLADEPVFVDGTYDLSLVARLVPGLDDEDDDA
jgi:acetyl-CoA carboxylase biotin carboxylase subunit